MGCTFGKARRQADSNGFDLFNDFYRFLNLWHQLIVGFQVPGVGFAACSLSRVRRDFTESERVLVAFVQPYRTALLQLAQPLRWQVPAGLGLTPCEAYIQRGPRQGYGPALRHHSPHRAGPPAPPLR